MRARWSETTERILAVIAAAPGLTFHEAAGAIGGREATAATTLTRLHRQGAVERVRVVVGDVVVDAEERVTRPLVIAKYTITDKGLRRLDLIRRARAMRAAATPTPAVAGTSGPCIAHDPVEGGGANAGIEETAPLL